MHLEGILRPREVTCCLAGPQEHTHTNPDTTGAQLWSCSEIWCALTCTFLYLQVSLKTEALTNHWIQTASMQEFLRNVKLRQFRYSHTKTLHQFWKKQGHDSQTVGHDPLVGCNLIFGGHRSATTRRRFQIVLAHSSLHWRCCAVSQMSCVPFVEATCKAFWDTMQCDTANNGRYNLKAALCLHPILPHSFLVVVGPVSTMDLGVGPKGRKFENCWKSKYGSM